MAGRTGLEPVTSVLTVRRYYQLSYWPTEEKLEDATGFEPVNTGVRFRGLEPLDHTPIENAMHGWSDLNTRHTDLETAALPG